MARKVEQMSPFAVTDYVADQLGLPESDALLKEISPKTVARRMGIPTLDDLSDEALAEGRQMAREMTGE